MFDKIAVTDARGKVHQAHFEMRDKSGVAEVSFDGTLPAQNIELAIDYNAAFNTKLQGLYKVKVGGDSYVVTQMEAISARYAFPSFDEPRFKTPFEVTLTVPKKEVAVANTRPTNRGCIRRRSVENDPLRQDQALANLSGRRCGRSMGRG